jgi:hypothetical protein
VPDGWVNLPTAAADIGCSVTTLKSRIDDGTFAFKKHPSLRGRKFTYILPRDQVDAATQQYAETGRIRAGSLNLRKIR